MSPFVSIAETWLALIATHTVETTLFLLLLWLLDRFLVTHVHTRYLLWCLGLLKLLVPPILTMPGVVERTVPDSITVLPVAVLTASGGPVAAGWPTAAYIFAVYLMVLVALAGFLLRQNIRLWRKLRSAERIDMPAGQESHLGGLTVRQCSALDSPVLFGFRAPVLYLPSGWKRWSSRELRTIIEHERAHMQHFDLWLLCLQYVTLLLFWFNPLVWFLHLRLSQLRELRSDEAAMRKSGMSAVQYSKILYAIIEGTHAKVNHPFVLAGHFWQRRHDLFERIHHLLTYEEKTMTKKHTRHTVLLALAALLIIPFSWNCNGDNTEPSLTGSVRKTGTEAGAEFDVPPEPVGGFEAIQKHLRYPEIGRKAGIEGAVILQVEIDENGVVGSMKVLQKPGGGSAGFDEAAMTAIRNVKWKPALLDGKPVAVKIAVPVIFKLNGSKAGVVTAHKSGEKYDKPPMPIGGFAAITGVLKYPEGARKKGLEGRVIVNLHISASGEVQDAVVKKSIKDAACDQAAVDALKSVQWEPAEREGKPVAAWVAVPVIFRLN